MFSASGCYSVHTFEDAEVDAEVAAETSARLSSKIKIFNTGFAGAAVGVRIWAYDDTLLTDKGVADIVMPAGEHCVQLGHSDASHVGYLADVDESARMAYLCFDAEAGQGYEIVHERETITEHWFQAGQDRTLYWIRRTGDGQIVAGPMPARYEVTTTATTDFGLASIASDSRVAANLPEHASGRDDLSGIHLQPVIVSSSSSDDDSFMGLLLVNLDGGVFHWWTATIDFPGIPRLGIPRRINFKPSGQEAIELPVQAGDPDWAAAIDYQPGWASNQPVMLETGVAELSPEQFEQIVKADSYSLEIEGTHQVISFTATEISDAFRTNLQKFYARHVQQ